MHASMGAEHAIDRARIDAGAKRMWGRSLGSLGENARPVTSFQKFNRKSARARAPRDDCALNLPIARKVSLIQVFTLRFAR